LWERHVEYLDKFLKRPTHADEATRLGILNRLTNARTTLTTVEAADYLGKLSGTLGAEPIEAYL
jgi:hypothetical protein